MLQSVEDKISQFEDTTFSTDIQTTVSCVLSMPSTVCRLFYVIHMEM